MVLASEKSQKVSSMREIRIGKVVLNIGVGKSGEALERAKKVIGELSGQKPAQSIARVSIRDFAIHRHEPIGVMATIRGRAASEVLRRLLSAKGMKILSRSFDVTGNFSFGIREHIEIPGMKYNPDVGIWGLDVSVALERAGYRIRSRKIGRGKVGKSHRIAREEAIDFARTALGVEVAEEIG